MKVTSLWPAPERRLPGRALVGSGSAQGPGGEGTGRVGSHGTWGEGRLDRGHHGLLQDLQDKVHFLIKALFLVCKWMPSCWASQGCPSLYLRLTSLEYI